MAGDTGNEYLSESRPEPREADAFLEHARAFWTAEETNAARLASHVRLLTTLSIGLLGIIAYRLTLSLPMALPDFSVLIAGSALATAIVVVFAPSSPLVGPKLSGFISAAGVVLLAAAAIAGLQVDAIRELAFSVLAGAASGLLICVLVLVVGTLVQLFYAEPPSVHTEDAPVSTSTPIRTQATASDRRSISASGRFSLSPSAIRRAIGVMLPSEWSVFWRRYEAAVDLRDRNGKLRDRIRKSQNLLTRSLFVGLVMLLAWLAAALVESL